VRGIQISVHFTFLLLLAYITLEGWREAAGIGAITNLATVLVFFSCVLLHELGHSFTARAYGVTVPRILLLPIGGMAEFTSIPEKPAQELAIAIAGPAVNFAIVLATLVFVPIPTLPHLLSMQLSPGQLLLTMNLVMGCFNLLPAFPMDGGRVLRALLATRVSFLDATRWAVRVGKVIALAGFCVMAFQLHHFLGAGLFLFIFVAGELEYRALLRRETQEKRWREMLRQLYGEADAPPLEQT
jgi:Zn-dependent protease